MACYLSTTALFSFSAFLLLVFLSFFFVLSFDRSLSHISLYTDLWPLNPFLSQNSSLSIPQHTQPIQIHHQDLKPNNASSQPSEILKQIDREKENDKLGPSAPTVGNFEIAEVKQRSNGSRVVDEDHSMPKVEALNKSCNLYDGTWERDEGNYPLYRPGSCPYVDDAFSCYDNGRDDDDYTKWRWKPLDCEMPRFNGTDFLERLRGKSLMIVGDSMNRNMFESLLCLLYEALPDKSRMYETRGHKVSKGRGYFKFRFKDYDCSVEFSRSHYLAREEMHSISKGKSKPILSIDCIDKSANRWKHADILIFNTGHWWTHSKTTKGKDYYKEGGLIHPQFDPTEAYRRAIRTWGKWIDKNVNPSKKLVFYRGYSNAHFRGGDWDSGGSCNGETQPILTGAYLENYPPKMRIVDEVIGEMKFPVILLNVTKLTNPRKDGHPSFHRNSSSKGRKSRQDCSHWCLPGVPDAWNELLYASILKQLGWF